MRSRLSTRARVPKAPTRRPRSSTFCACHCKALADPWAYWPCGCLRSVSARPKTVDCCDAFANQAALALRALAVRPPQRQGRGRRRDGAPAQHAAVRHLARLPHTADHHHRLGQQPAGTGRGARRHAPHGPAAGHAGRGAPHARIDERPAGADAHGRRRGAGELRVVPGRRADRGSARGAGPRLRLRTVRCRGAARGGRVVRPAPRRPGCWSICWTTRCAMHQLTAAIEIRIETRGGSSWRLIVADDGPGLPPGQEDERLQEVRAGARRALPARAPGWAWPSAPRWRACTAARSRRATMAARASRSPCRRRPPPAHRSTRPA